jgi:hypothetical protein
MLREILEQINGISNGIDRREFTPEQNAALRRIENAVDKALRDFQNNELQALKNSIGNIEQALNDINAEKRESVVRHHHRLSIDVGSSKRFIANLVVLALIFVLSYVVGEQRRDLARFRDNDLKYRYIQMRGAASSADILRLRNVFDFNRNHDSIKLIRRQVTEYERLVRERAEKDERARLNASEAERLRNEAETVKSGAAKNGTGRGGMTKEKK